jgi:hypothetical protein
MRLLNTGFYISIFLTLFSFHKSFSQDVEHNGWFFWSHKQEISKKWQFSSDIQVRSADRLNYVNTLLIRPGIGYKIADNQTITLGYTYFGMWEKENDETTYVPENRIFEQYQIRNKIKRIEITNRIRYEQRFIHQPDNKIFAQRIRHYIQAQFPLVTDQLFTKGLYAAVQNEIFIHIQGKDKLNHSVFNQNRSYAGLGYRFSKKLELEVDYMFRYIIQKDVDGRNNVLQLFVKTSF